MYAAEWICFTSGWVTVRERSLFKYLNGMINPPKNDRVRRTVEERNYHSLNLWGDDERSSYLKEYVVLWIYSHRVECESMIPLWKLISFRHLYIFHQHQTVGQISCIESLLHVYKMFSIELEYYCKMVMVDFSTDMPRKIYFQLAIKSLNRGDLE